MTAREVWSFIRSLPLLLWVALALNVTLVAMLAYRDLRDGDVGGALLYLTINGFAWWLGWWIGNNRTK